MISKSTDHSKHLFNHSIYLLADCPERVSILQAFFSLFTGPSSEVTAKVYTREDEKVNKTLGIKQSDKN